MPASIVPSAVRSNSIAAAMTSFLFVCPADFLTCLSPPVSGAGTSYCACQTLQPYRFLTEAMKISDLLSRKLSPVFANLAGSCCLKLPQITANY